MKEVSQFDIQKNAVTQTKWMGKIGLTDWFKHYLKYITLYPNDCPGKDILLMAAKECPQESLIAFMVACEEAKDARKPFSPVLLRLLKDEDDMPVFAEFCDRIAPHYKGLSHVTENAANTHTVSRRAVLKKALGGALLAAQMGEAYASSFTDLSSWEDKSGHVKKGKIGRLVAETYVGLELIDSANKDATVALCQHVIEELNIAAEKQMGIQLQRKRPSPKDQGGHAL